MKTILSILAFSLIAMTINAQRVDLDKFNFTASYRDLPRLSVDTSYRTFFMTIDANPLLRYSLRDYKPDENIQIEGWKKLNNNGHIKINTRMEDVVIDNSEVQERIEIIKDKNGKETGRRSFYYVQLTYTFAANATVTDYKGNHLLSIPLAYRNNKQTYNSQEFTSHTEANFYFKFQGYVLIGQVMRKAVVGSMNQLSNHLQVNFGFPGRTVGDFLWILDSKKHPEYQAHRKAWFVFKQAFFQMNADEPLDNVRSMLAPVISYYEKTRKKYSSNSKADKKIRYASCFNLAKIYYYLDDAEAAMREAGELVMNEYDEKDGRRLEAAAADLKMQLKQSKRTGRHFSIETAQLEGPPSVTSR